MALNSYKTTFYKHYDDIYALANETENKAIDSVVNCFTEKDDIFANPILFIEGLPKALDKNKSFLEPLFHDNFDKFFFLLEKKLKDYYGISSGDMEEKIRLTFIVGGVLHTLRTMKYEYDCDDSVLADTVSDIICDLLGH